ncbi:hypothetical protein HPB49_021319 [Dermacentor silvarum]|uniref:Uncharacterized protein n=1 Tax=Dermacentor silvarum TaxID=543639 RepID=A0ACB8D0D8_DERSI|nr:hypothetical protein HPB49_021319 [Dermacentor silvarum]
MPSNAELAKKIEQLESLLNNKLDNLIDSLASKIAKQLDDQGLGNLTSLADSVRYMSDQYDKVRTTVAELVDSNKDLRAQNEALARRIADMEQYSRLNNIEIKGIPCTQGEDCAVILKTIAEVVECPISSSDIDAVHRVPSKTAEKSIIARFCSRDKKNEFIRKARKARLRTSQIGLTGSKDNAVYVNEHLTIDNKRLFSKALALKKAMKWRYLWTENCHIRARKTEDSKVFRISAESDLRIFT